MSDSPIQRIDATLRQLEALSREALIERLGSLAALAQLAERMGRLAQDAPPPTVTRPRVIATQGQQLAPGQRCATPHCTGPAWGLGGDGAPICLECWQLIERGRK